MPEEIATPDLIDQLSAFFGQSNLALSAPVYLTGRVLGERMFRDRRELTPDQLLAAMTPEERINAHEFAGARSIADLQQIRAEKRFQAKLAEISNSGPLNTMLGHALAAIGDPVSYVPLLGSSIKGASALSLGARIGGEVAATELAFHAIQRDREVADSLAAVVIGATFGMGIGRAVAGRPASEIRAVQDTATRQYAQLLRDTAANTDSVGAMANKHFLDPENTEAAGTFGLGALANAAERAGAEPIARGARALKRGFSRLIPSYEVLNSPFPAARRWLLELTHPAVPTKGNFKGFANPENLETQIHAGRALMHEANGQLEALWREAKVSGFAGSRKQFYDTVGKALHRGAIPSDPVIRRAWQWMNANIFDPLKKAGDSAKIWDDLGVRFRNAPRIMDARKLRVSSKVFDERVTDWLQIKYPEWEREYLEDVAAQIRQKYMGHPVDRFPVGMKVSVSKKGRTLDILADDIPFNVVEDFVINDAQAMVNRFVRTMTADIATKRKFGELNPEGTIEKEIRAEADAMKALAKSEREAKLIEDQADRHVEVLRHIYRHVRGVQGAPGDKINAGLYQSMAIFRNYGFTRVGGSIILGSFLPDLAMNVFTHGLSRTLSTSVQELVNGFKGTKLAKVDLMRAGDAMDYATATQVSELYEIGSRYETGTIGDVVSDVSRSAAQKLSRWQLLTAWNDWSKSFNSVMTTTMVLEVAEKVAQGRGHLIAARDRLHLNRIGLDDAALAEIAKEAPAWERRGSLVFANTEAWKNGRMRQRFSEAVSTMARNATITPFEGDVPNLIKGELGKTVFQFKKFGIAATGRITLTAASRLQHGDVSVLNGLLVLLAGGLMTNVVRDLAAHGEVKDRSAEEWIIDAVDRSGVLAPLMEMDNVSRAFTGRSIFGSPVSRYAGRGRSGVLLGPSGDFVMDDLGDMMTMWADGEYEPRDVQKMMRLAPGNNLPVINGLINSLED